MHRPEPAERLVFSTVVEGLLKHGLGGELPPALKERLKAEGIDVERPLRPAYPVQVWQNCLHQIVAHYSPQLAREDAFRQLGRQMADGYAHTFLGRALYGLMRLLGPNRSLKRMAQNLGSSDNYTNVTLTELSPSEFEMKMNSKLEIRGYAEGIFEAMLETAGARAVRVQETARSDADTTYRIRWSA